MNPEIRIFVINLATCVERRRRTAGRLSALGLSAQSVTAVEAAAAVPALPSGAPGLSALEAACLASHTRALELIAAGDDRLACVIEDDCDLGDPFAGVLAALARGSRRDWDVLLLGHHSARHDARDGAETCFRGRAIIAGYRDARVAEFPMGAYAYVVTRAGAQTLLRHATPPRMPADWVTGYCEAAGLRLHAVSPPCVRPLPDGEAPSTIDDRGPRSGAPATSVPRLRAWGGDAWLLARRLGWRPGAYARPY